MPVTIPVADPTVATAVLLLLHVPPPLAGSVSVEIRPTQTLVFPVIVVGGALTVTMVVALHPEVRE
jgi:hypothetical protein